MPDPNAGPNWIAEAFAQTVKELREFLSTSASFLAHPGKFADEWYRGERHAMNPVGCLATAAAIIVPIEELLAQLFPGEAPKTTLLVQALNALGPYLHYAALGAIAHWLLRTASSSRSLRGTVGVALYAGTLPGLGGSLLAAASLALFLSRHPDSSSEIHAPSVLVPILGAFVTFVWAACAGLAGLHRIRWWRALGALTVAFVATGLVFGQGHLAGRWGLHLEVNVWTAGHAQIFFGLKYS